MDTSKYLDLYVTECREHLARMRRAIPAGEAVQSSALAELFRSAHSLKGMAASMGFEATSSLAHRMETLLGRWRDGEAPTAGQSTTLLAALDALDSLVDQAQATGSDKGLEETVERAIRGLEAGPAVPAAVSAPPFERPAPPSPASQPPPLRTSGRAAPSVRVTVAIDPASPLPAARLAVVMNRVREAFPDFAMEPGLAEIQAGNLRSAAFLLPDSPQVKELARSIQGLSEVSAVSLEREAAPAAAHPGQVLVGSLRVQSADLDALLAQTSDLLFQLNAFQAALPEGERHRHRFWLESHRSSLNRLFDQVLAVRLVPFDSLVDRLARAVRELSGRLGKPVRFEHTGSDQQVDRSVLEKLLDPLMHLARNAVDHGIEGSADRAAAGKPAAGLLKLSIAREGEALFVTLEDDGRGIDLEAVRQAAAERGLYSPQEAALLDRGRLLELLTLPAFTTRREVSEVSGRGVGLDVVRAAVESLGGHLEMATEAGQGSRFSLVLPSALTLTQVLVFGWEDELRYGLPSSQIQSILDLAVHPLVRQGSRRYLDDGGELLPVLRWGTGPSEGRGYALRISAPQRDRVLVVSRVYQSERVVILPWGPPLEMVPEWMGGALLSTGDLAYILDGRALVKRDGEDVHVQADDR